MGIRDQFKNLVDESRSSRQTRDGLIDTPTPIPKAKEDYLVRYSVPETEDAEESIIGPKKPAKRGRPQKEDFEKAKKIYVKLTSEKLSYFYKITSKNGQKLNGDTSRVGYLLEEYRKWDKVRDRYVKNLKELLAKVDRDIANRPNSPNIDLVGDFVNIFGLKLSELEPYFSKSQFTTLKFCINYLENRRIDH